MEYCSTCTVSCEDYYIRASVFVCTFARRNLEPNLERSKEAGCILSAI